VKENAYKLQQILLFYYHSRSFFLILWYVFKLLIFRLVDFMTYLSASHTLKAWKESS